MKAYDFLASNMKFGEVGYVIVLMKMYKEITSKRMHNRIWEKRIMARPRKDYHSITIKMATSLYDELDQFCKESGQSKTFVIEHSVTEYIKNYKKRQKIIDEIIKTDN